MADSINFHTTHADDILSLARIRATLQRMEDSIVFRLIERAQFAHNERMYEPGSFVELQEKEGWNRSWLEWFLFCTESAHAKLGRWLAPDEYAFTPAGRLPEPILKPVDYPAVLHAHHVNVCPEILTFYTREIVPPITARADAPADDRQYGSSAICDVEALGAISRRIHFGMFVSESKFREDPAAFIPHIRARDRGALAALITKPSVEVALLQRVAQKTDVYGQNLDQTHQGCTGDADSRKIQAQEVVRLYREFIIPLTKEVEIDYLLERLDGLGDKEVSALANAT
ncbi:chorismate mutase [Malassezia sp. CBS 17886]|nr:chorismate mutase [Malassezia sp. CBS 17886]